MTPGKALLALAFVVAGALVACGGASLSGAKSDFDAGKYAEAKRELVPMEGEARGWGDHDRSVYALYRGLTHLALGDRAEAAKWLHEAKVIEDARPGALDADDRARMSLALEALGPETAP